MASKKSEVKVRHFRFKYFHQFQVQGIAARMRYGHWFHGSVLADVRVLGNFVRTGHDSNCVDILIIKKVEFGVLKTNMRCIKILGLRQRMVFLVQYIEK